MSTLNKSKPKKWFGAVLAVLSLFVFAGAASAQVATSTATSTDSNANATTTYQVMIMKHLCNQNIKTMTELQNLEATGTPVEAFARLEYNCPTTGLYGNNPMPGTIAAPRSTFDFQVWSGEATSTKTLSANGTFTPMKVCESDLGIDINQSGVISTTTCLDASSYNVPVTVASSTASTTASSAGQMVTVKESMPPFGYHFGTVRFTPPAVMPNNDAATLSSIDTNNATINLNMATDTDKMVMLHVFNLTNATTSTTTPDDLSDIDKQDLLTLIANLQQQVNILIAKVQQLFDMHNDWNNGNGGNGNNGGGMGTTSPIFQSNARVRAAALILPIGDSVDFAGERFGSSEQVVMSSDGQTLDTFQTDKEGNFNTGSIYVPRTPGYKTYTFTGQTSGAVRSVTLTVTPIP